jgi:predicted Fe-Mo cluster-binding NifX family protein
VAPVLNWCSRVVIFPASAAGGGGQELWIPELGPPERLQLLQEKGVNTLICGALTPDLQTCAVELGLKVIPGVAGEIDQVLIAYRQNRLDQPEFWLPGCRGLRRYRQGLGNGGSQPSAGNRGGASTLSQRGRGPGGRCRPGAGPGTASFCICPTCGAKTPHARGIPCTQVSCPRCGNAMVRE